MRKALLALLLFLPLAGAEGIMVEGNLSFMNDATNDTMVLPFTYQFLLPALAENETVHEENEEEPCPPLVIEGLPLIGEDGEKVSYWFSPWQEGDEVTYWIEGLDGEEVKSPYTTSSESKKSYTPSVEGEKVLVFFAEREREGCDRSVAQAVMAVIGAAVEEEVCEPDIILETVIVQEPCDLDEPQSLYVRAKNWQENITLYGNAVGEHWLFGEETPILMDMNGTFSTTIHPKKGNNTYGLVASSGGIPKIVRFYMEYEEGDRPIEEEVVNATEQQLTGSFVFEAPEEPILEDGTARNTTIIAGLTGLLGIGIGVSGLKTKILRRKRHSA